MNNKKFERYTNKVLSLISCNGRTRRKIKDDILDTLYSHYEEHGIDDSVYIMGEAHEVAKEFSENLSNYQHDSKEYISKIKVFGLPLFHITSDRYSVAKGFIAVGIKSIGVISVGALSAGVLSFGAISVGLIAFGGIAAAVLGAFGGVAVAYDMAVGGVAIAKSLAIGGLAIAQDIAIGGMTMAKLMGYSQEYMIPQNLSQSEVHAFKFPDNNNAFKQMYDVLFHKFGYVKDAIIRALAK